VATRTFTKVNSVLTVTFHFVTKKIDISSLTGTRQAFLPGGHRTGAPGKHVVGGASKYRLLDEKVRVFVAPPLQMIDESKVSIFICSTYRQIAERRVDIQKLKPYVALDVRLTNSQRKAVFGKFPENGLTPEHFLKVAQRVSLERAADFVQSGAAEKTSGGAT
jgi:large subunit ribosomal protein L41